MGIYLTSDLHLGHDKPFVYEARGFRNICEHDDAIVKNWNEIISFDDDVYVLGDLMLGKNDAGISRIKSLNGKLHIIIGNHDTRQRIELYKQLYNVESVDYVTLLKYNNTTFYLSHYQTITSQPEFAKPTYEKNIINLHGHTHQTNPITNKYTYNVGVDANDMRPISIDEVIKRLKENV